MPKFENESAEDRLDAWIESANEKLGGYTSIRHGVLGGTSYVTVVDHCDFDVRLYVIVGLSNETVDTIIECGYDDLDDILEDHRVNFH